MAVGAKDWTLYEQWNCKYITGVIQSGCDRPSPVVYQADVCIGKEKYTVAGDTITLSRYEDDDCTRLRPGQQFKYKNDECALGSRFTIYKGPAAEVFRSVEADCSAKNPMYGIGQMIIQDQCNQDGAIYACSSNYETISKTSFEEPSCVTKIDKITREQGKCVCVENCPPVTKAPVPKAPVTKAPVTKAPVNTAVGTLATELVVLFWILGFCCCCGLVWAIYFCFCGGRFARGRRLSITARQPGQSYIKFIPDDGEVAEGAETGSYMEMK